MYNHTCPRPIRTPTSVNMGKVEKIKMTKSRPVVKTTFYTWCDWLISHTPESVKKSASNFKGNIKKFFETIIDKNLLKG